MRILINRSSFEEDKKKGLTQALEYIENGSVTYLPIVLRNGDAEWVVGEVRPTQEGEDERMKRFFYTLN